MFRVSEPTALETLTTTGSRLAFEEGREPVNDGGCAEDVGFKDGAHIRKARFAESSLIPGDTGVVDQDIE